MFGWMLIPVRSATSRLVRYSSFVLIPEFVELPASGGVGFGASVTQAGIFLLPRLPHDLGKGGFARAPSCITWAVSRAGNFAIRSRPIRLETGSSSPSCTVPSQIGSATSSPPANSPSVRRAATTCSSGPRASRQHRHSPPFAPVAQDDALTWLKDFVRGHRERQSPRKPAGSNRSGTLNIVANRSADPNTPTIQSRYFSAYAGF